MPATIAALTRASRTLIPFSIKLRSAGRSVQFVAFARSSGDALCDALALPDLALPVAASVKPVDGMRVFSLKTTLADLVE